MADQKQLERIERSVTGWNAWRRRGSSVRPDLRGVCLSGANLFHANLSDADLRYADLTRTNLRKANLMDADLRDANLSGADLSDADLSDANLRRAKLVNADLRDADLSGTDLTAARFSDADLANADLATANLSGADFRNAHFAGTYFSATTISACDLREARRLANARFWGASSLDSSTLRIAHGSLPSEFLRGCGLENWEIAIAGLHNPGLSSFDVAEITSRVFDMRSEGPIFLGGVFISYSRNDLGFVDALEQRLQESGCAVWRDIHDLVAGPLVRQIADAIRLNDSVVVVLSKESVASDWVTDEVEKTRGRERKEGRDVLCPISLDDSWKALDHPVWTQLTREKNILDFSDWSNDALFDKAFAKLLRGLKRYYPPGGRSPSK